jgi:hypothetical protein
MSDPTLPDITKHADTLYTLFSPAEAKAVQEAISYNAGGKATVTCQASHKARHAKPEEIVRQLWIVRLLRHYGYPVERIAVEPEFRVDAEYHRKRYLCEDRNLAKYANVGIVVN